MLKPLKHRAPPTDFAVYDIETTTDLKRVYLCGYYDGSTYHYWESPPLPPEHPQSAITQFLRWRFARPTKLKIYAHNGGNFDAVFGLVSIIKNWPQYRLELIPSSSAILIMTVKATAKSRQKWTFLDSARMLPDSLDSLARCFLPGRHKIKDGIDYDTLHMNPLRYEYLRNDCVLLYDVLTEYFRSLHDDIGGTTGVSAASTALATFRASYQRHTLPDISEHANGLARAGYYGGRCEPFRRSYDGPNLHCYDVNSMYPACMTERQPVEELDVRGVHIDLCGFIDATVDVAKSHLPVLPCRTRGKLLFPYGTFRGVFATVELRLAESIGQLRRLQYHDSVYFRTDDIFSDYVRRLYALRQKSCDSRPAQDHAQCQPPGPCRHWSQSLDRLAKLLLNSLYGKFGSNEIRETIHVSPSLKDVIERQMEPLPSSLGGDIYLERTEQHAEYMLPQISAWITSLARTRLAEKLLSVESDAYYCDTDSIYTDRTIAGVGASLGDWKDEYAHDPIVRAYFLAPKVYVLQHRSGAITNKAKGFSRFGQSLPEDIVQRLSEGESVEVSRFTKMRSAIRGEFGMIFSQKRMHLHTYEKRIFNDNGTSEAREIHEC